MPWRGPAEAGEFPTLGYDVGEWIEANVKIPDGYRRGEPYLLTDEMLRFLLRFYRLDPVTGRLAYFGGQLRRSQKWGKDPFGAAIILAEALGPARFDGWDARGEPVGAPYPTPYIPLLGVSDDQAMNTYAPLLEMIRLGPLLELPGMDAGETRVELPGGGTIEPVTSSPRSRLGQRMTFATLTEPHLWVESRGGRTLGAAVKRNLAGMDGRWLELTNAWDPAEHSEAQATAEGKEPGVLIDTIEPQRVVDLNDDLALRTELLRQYGDSALERGGWVNLDRITAEIRSPRVLEADARRYFLNEIVAGSQAFVDPLRWAELGDATVTMPRREWCALGFDGSKSRDSTALIACRRSDMRLFVLGTWERPRNIDIDDEWEVPRDEVRACVAQAFKTLRVGFMYCDPWGWENDIDAWAQTYGEKRVLGFPTNQEQRMDKALHRFLVGIENGEIAHDANEVLARHIGNAVLSNAGRKATRDPDDPGSAFYRRIGKRSRPLKIDAAVAAVLAYEAAANMPLRRPAVGYNLAELVAQDNARRGREQES
jgi:hypothetical protein